MSAEARDEEFAARMEQFKRELYEHEREYQRRLQLPLIYRRESAGDLKYVRSVHAWRRPVVHVLRSARCESLQTTFGIFRTMCTNVAPFWDANVYESLSNGMTVCQPCALAVANAAMRERERTSPNRSAYNELTNRLLEEVA